MDYIDRQIQALQTHIDNKMVLLMDLVQNSKPNKISQAHYDSNEGFSNGERQMYIDIGLQCKYFKGNYTLQSLVFMELKL